MRRIALTIELKGEMMRRNLVAPNGELTMSDICRLVTELENAKLQLMRDYQGAVGK